MIDIVFWLLCWHALADYPLQGDFLARAKNRFNPIPGVPWYHALGAHATIHAAGVAYVTGNVWIGLLEFLTHWVIDDAKCCGHISYSQDQGLHVACKILWAALALQIGVPE